MSYSLARSLLGDRERLALYPDARKIFLNNGKLYSEGDKLRQPELANIRFYDFLLHRSCLLDKAESCNSYLWTTP